MVMVVMVLLLAESDACEAGEQRCVCGAGLTLASVEEGAWRELGRCDTTVQQASAHRVRVCVWRGTTGGARQPDSGELWRVCPVWKLATCEVGRAHSKLQKG